MNKTPDLGVSQLEEDGTSVCSIFIGNQTFGIDTNKIREVLGPRDLQHVPMAPEFVAGVIPYRGDVLSVVNFPALLGPSETHVNGCVLVLDDQQEKERFGLMVDRVGGVMVLKNRTLDVNPSTLNNRCRWLFDGVYKHESGLVVKLDPERLRPTRLAGVDLFKQSRLYEVAV